MHEGYILCRKDTCYAGRIHVMQEGYMLCRKDTCYAEKIHVMQEDSEALVIANKGNDIETNIEKN